MTNSTAVAAMLFGPNCASRLRRRALRKGEFLTRDGDPSSYVFRVQAGGLILVSEREDGSYIATDWVGPGGLVGLENAIRGGPCESSCRATVESTVQGLPVGEVQRALRADPAVALAIMNYLSDRVRFLAGHAETLALEGLAVRVRRTLQTLAERELADGRPASLHLTQGDLAALAGASRQRVNSTLMALRRAGVVELRGGAIKILSPAAL